MKTVTMTKQYPTDRLFSLPRLVTLEGINVLARRAAATRRLQVSRVLRPVQ